MRTLCTSYTLMWGRAFLVGLMGITGSLAPTALRAKDGITDFTGVAKEALPAVVTIQVQVKPKTSALNNPWGGLGGGLDSDDEMSDQDLFQFFFGFPRGRSFAEKQPTQGQASGFIIRPDGYILTNAHVVQDAEEVIVQLNDGTEYPAKIIGSDSNTDIAVLKIEGKSLPSLALGNSDDLQVGQWVIAIGNSLGLQATLTVGVVSAKGRNNLDLARVEDFIQTDAAINRGNSGGPLLNLEGQVIGMNTAIVTPNGGYVGVGFAIPSNIISHVMEELINDGSVTRGFMGVSLQPVDSNIAQAFGLDKAEGVLVSDVQKGSPADDAGIRQGDIILKFKGQSVSNGGSLRTIVSLMKPGSEVPITILRDGKSLELKVKVGAFPEEKAAVASAPEQINKLGFSVETLTGELAAKIGQQGVQGVVITRVEPGSVAAWAGLKKGSVILAVNQKKVSTLEQFKQEVQNTPSGKPVLFLIKQGESTRFVSLKVN